VCSHFLDKITQQKIPDLSKIKKHTAVNWFINPSNAELNPICHLLTLLEAQHILHVSGVRVNFRNWTNSLRVELKIFSIFQ
jgi:hypothetical protein